MKVEIPLSDGRELRLQRRDETIAELYVVTKEGATSTRA